MRLFERSHTVARRRKGWGGKTITPSHPIETDDIQIVRNQRKGKREEERERQRREERPAGKPLSLVKTRQPLRLNRRREAEKGLKKRKKQSLNLDRSTRNMRRPLRALIFIFFLSSLPIHSLAHILHMPPYFPIVPLLHPIHQPHKTSHLSHKGHKVSSPFAPSPNFFTVAIPTSPTFSLTSSSVPAASTTCQIESPSINF